jgi:hypothetical protein
MRYTSGFTKEIRSVETKVMRVAPVRPIWFSHFLNRRFAVGFASSTRYVLDNIYVV